MMKWMRLTIMLLGLCVGGCALNGYQPVKYDEYPAVRQMFDITFGWKMAVADNVMTINGYARNNRYFIVQDLDLAISLVAENGKVKETGTFFFLPIELRQEENSKFTIRLGARPEPGDKLRFVYRYRYVEDSEDSHTWLNSFEVKALD